MGPRVYTMLENNPEVMTALAHTLGLSTDLSFYDVYSVDDPALLAHIPRPVTALLAIIPFTPAWGAARTAEDANKPLYEGSGPDEPVLWMQQTIINGCGLIGLLHCLCNGVPRDMVRPGSPLADFIDRATPLGRAARAELLHADDAIFRASEAAAQGGDTHPVDEADTHFVALVRTRDGHLWELEGGRKGPLDRGVLAEGEDALSEEGLRLGLGALIDLQRREACGDVRFSCIALAPSTE